MEDMPKPTIELQQSIIGLGCLETLKNMLVPAIFVKRLSQDDMHQSECFNRFLFPLTLSKWYPWILFRNYQCLRV